MRFLIAGLLLIAFGIGVTEYQRRHPPHDEPRPSDEEKKGAQALPGPPPSTAALLETAAPDEAARTPGPQGAFADVASLAGAGSADGFTAVLSGKVSLRELKATGGTAVLVLDRGGHSGLLAAVRGQPPRLLAARPGRITAVAVTADAVAFAEAGTLFTLPLAGGEPKALTTFPRATVVALAAKGELLVAALVPRGADPFSTEASGAVVAVSPEGKASLLAGELVRPGEVLVVGDDTYWIAGYPTGLYRAGLDGSFSARIAERAAGPLAFDGEGLVHRYPQAGAPEVRRVARAGGSATTLSRADAELLASAKGVTWYTSTGTAPHLYSVEAGGEARDVAGLQGTPTGLAATESSLFLLTSDGAGVAQLRVRP